MTDLDTDGNDFARPFAEFLRDQAKGRTHAELTEGLHDLIAAVQNTGKAGTLTLTVRVAPMPKSDGRMVTVTDKVAVKAPTLDRAESIFFVDHGGNLTRNDPDQMEITGLRAVATPEERTARNA